MRIAFLNPPWYIFDTERKMHLHGVRAGCRWPSLGPGGLPHFSQMRGNTYMPYPFHLGYAASRVAAHGHDVLFYDAIAECDDFSRFYMRVAEFDPDVAVIETASVSTDTDMRVARILSEEYGIRIALVGPHATTYADSLINEPFATGVLTREYDDLALELANGAAPGILRGALPDDLDNRPFPMLDLPSALYYQDYFGFNEFKRPQVQIWTTRGCVYSCTFCLWRHTMYADDGRGSYRQRTAANVLAEVDDRVNRFGFQQVLFDDDTFSIVGREQDGSVGYDRVIGICDGMKERGIEWTFMSRLDVHSLALFERMRESGCVGMKVGAEAFNDRALEGITKHLKAKDMIERIKALIDLEFRVYLATTTYIPGESEDDRKRTGEILEELASYGNGRLKWQRPHMTPIPGTPLYDQFKAEGYFDEAAPDWSLFDAGNGRMHHIIQRFNQVHAVGGFESGRHAAEEPGHFAGQPGLKGKIKD